MEYEIHPTAVIADGAVIGKGATIGAYTVIGPHVVVGDGVKIHSHVVLDGWTEIGPQCQIFPGAQIGGPPQDVKYKDFESYAQIGPNCIIRECATIHRSSKEGGATKVGAGCFLMAYTHVAHDCLLGEQVIITNYSGLAGHVIIEDYAYLSGMVAVHQFCRIGKLSMTTAGSMVGRDLPPFFTSLGYPAIPAGVNAVGLRRRGIPANVRQDIKQAFMLLYRSELNTKQALERIRETIPLSDEIAHLLNFIESSKRGVSKSRRMARMSAEEMEEIEVF
jgi:UDP-N-acetylglucosamine acyltransferase